MAGVPQREIEVALRVGRAEDDRWHVRKDGSRFYGSGILAPIHEPPDGLIGFIKVLRDQTERMRAEKERERLLTLATESNRIRDEFLSTISHELRTPLNSVFGWTQLLRQGSVASHMVPQALEIIERNARQQAELIDDLLDVSRIVTGKLRLQLEPVPLAAIASAAIESLRPAADAKGIKMSGAVWPTACRLRRRRSAAADLLEPAVERHQVHAGRRPRRRVVDACTAHVELAVRDTGIGIATGVPAARLRPLPAGRQRTTRMQAASGWDSPSCATSSSCTAAAWRWKAPAAARGRPFACSCRALPCQHMVVPLTSQCFRRLRFLPECSKASAFSSWTMSPMPGSSWRLRLAEPGPRSILAGSSAAALEAAAITAPHIVLVDLAMPEVDGFGFLKRFRAITGATRLVPVVAVTAYTRQEDRDRCFAAGFDAHITKPIDLRQLVTLVAGLLVSDDGNGT